MIQRTGYENTTKTSQTIQGKKKKKNGRKEEDEEEIYTYVVVFPWWQAV